MGFNSAFKGLKLQLISVYIFISIMAVSYGRMWKSLFAGMTLTVYITWY